MGCVRGWVVSYLHNDGLDDVRKRLDELADTFDDCGTEELHGKALGVAVRKELTKLPKSEQEVWLSTRGNKMQTAIKRTHRNGVDVWPPAPVDSA